MQLFIVGKRDSEADADRGWEFQGVFSDETKACAACTSRFHFVGPAILDHELPDETVVWDGAYFPKAVADAYRAKWAGVITDDQSDAEVLALSRINPT